MATPSKSKKLTADQISKRYVKLCDNGKILASQQRVVDDPNASEFDKRMAVDSLIVARAALDKYMVNWGVLPPTNLYGGKPEAS